MNPGEDMACWPTWPMPVWRGCGPARPTAYVRDPAERELEAEGGLYRARAGHPGVLPGTDLDALLEQETLRLDGQVIDADVHVGRGTHALSLRLVGVQTPKGYCFFLTNLPPGSARGRSPTSIAYAGR